MAEKGFSYRDGDLLYCTLTPHYKIEAHEILAEIFCDLPACETLIGYNSEITRTFVKKFWLEYISYEIDDFVTDGLSIMALGKDCRSS